MEGISQYTNVLAKQLRDHHRANLIHSAIAMGLSHKWTYEQPLFYLD